MCLVGRESSRERRREDSHRDSESYRERGTGARQQRKVREGGYRPTPSLRFVPGRGSPEDFVLVSSKLDPFLLIP